MSRLSGSPGALLAFSESLADSPPGLLSLAEAFHDDATGIAALRLLTSAPLATGEGTGTNSSDNYASLISLEPTVLRITEILVEIDGLVSAATDNDVIGDTGGQANAHIGQIIAAESGTILAGVMECIEAPVTGELDIDLYADSSGTIAQSADGTGDTALLQVGTNWTAGLRKVLTGVPAANDYLYLTVGTSSTPTAGTYTAGIFKITFYGV